MYRKKYWQSIAYLLKKVLTKELQYVFIKSIVLILRHFKSIVNKPVKFMNEPQYTINVERGKLIFIRTIF